MTTTGVRCHGRINQGGAHHQRQRRDHVSIEADPGDALGAIKAGMLRLNNLIAPSFTFPGLIHLRRFFFVTSLVLPL